MRVKARTIRTQRERETSHLRCVSQRPCVSGRSFGRSSKSGEANKGFPRFAPPRRAHPDPAGIGEGTDDGRRRGLRGG
jgi:hypothetical protein